MAAGAVRAKIKVTGIHPKLSGSDSVYVMADLWVADQDFLELPLGEQVEVSIAAFPAPAPDGTPVIHPNPKLDDRA